MCNLYSITTAQEAVRRFFAVERDLAGNLPPLPAVFPGHMAPVVRKGEDDKRELVMLRWGFPLPREGRTPKDVTNARSDKVAISPFWRQSFEARRCLVPATSFCEWTDSRPKVPHWFALKNGEARPLFAFAGLWRNWRGRYKDELVDWTVFAILTCLPNEIVRPIHAKAMPVMVPPESFGVWLDGSPNEALALARPFEAARMRIAFTGETKDEGEGASLGRLRSAAPVGS
jgi:putative SOS response-associated peptidase YedK